MSNCNEGIRVGDLVKRISGTQHGMEAGDTDYVAAVGETAVTLRDFGEGHAKNKLTVIEYNSECTASEKPTMLKSLNVFIKKHLDPKVQSLLKRGFYNGDLRPTSEGDRALLDILHMENIDKLAAQADVEIAEAESKEAKK